MKNFGKVFKYQMRSRSTAMILLVGIMTALTIIANILVAASGGEMFTQSNLGTVEIFMSFEMIALFGIPFVMFFYCGNAYVNTLLYKNTNYLILSLPVQSAALLGARLLAGLVEFIIYSLSAGILGVFTVALVGSAQSDESFGSIISEMFQMAVHNISPIFVLILSSLAFFFFIGSTIMVVLIAVRTLIRKNRRLAMVTSGLVVAFLLIRLMIITEKLSGSWVLKAYIRMPMFGMFADQSQTVGQITIPGLSLVFLFVCSAVFFVAASWLLKHKTEV